MFHRNKIREKGQGIFLHTNCKEKKNRIFLKSRDDQEYLKAHVSFLCGKDKRIKQSDKLYGNNKITVADHLVKYKHLILQSHLMVQIP